MPSIIVTSAVVALAMPPPYSDIHFPAQTREEVRIVTYNVGLKQDQANRSIKKYNPTVEKYKTDFEDLSWHFNVICVQELSAMWTEEVCSWLQGLADAQGFHWRYHRNDHGIVTFWVEEDWDSVPVTVEVDVFPNAVAVGKRWRKFLQTSFKAVDRIWVVSNAHSIDGKDERKIPDEEFRSQCMTHVCKYTISNAVLAKTQDNDVRWIACGDFNKCSMEQCRRRLSQLPDCAGRYASVCDPVRMSRDYIIGQDPMDYSKTSEAMPIALDGQHTAVGARCFSAKRVEPPLPQHTSLQQVSHTMPSSTTLHSVPQQAFHSVPEFSYRTRALEQDLFGQLREDRANGKYSRDTIWLAESQASSLRRTVEEIATSRIEADNNASTDALDMQATAEELNQTDGEELAEDPPDWGETDEVTEKAAQIDPIPSIRGVIKENNVMTFSGELNQAAISVLFLLRNRLLEACALEQTQGTYLPFQFQKQGQKDMFDAWKQLPYVAEIRSRTERVSATRDAANRSLKSYYKKYLKEAYGGAEWANIVLAIGVIDADIVECVNEEVQRRVSASVPRPQAKRKDRGYEEVAGVQHTISNAKQLRAHASSLDKVIATQNALYNAGRRCMRRWEWEALQGDRDAAWDEAEGVSYQEGNKFKDRNGTWQCDSVNDLVGISLREWCMRKCIAYS